MRFDLIILSSVLVISILSVAAIAVISIYNSKEKSKMAAENGCEYLGTARDLIGVDFYDCKGEIIMRRRGSKL